MESIRTLTSAPVDLFSSWNYKSVRVIHGKNQNFDITLGGWGLIQFMILIHSVRETVWITESIRTLTLPPVGGVSQRAEGSRLDRNMPKRSTPPGGWCYACWDRNMPKRSTPPGGWCPMGWLSRLFKTIGLFCRRALYKRWYFAKETCNLKEPANRIHSKRGTYTQTTSSIQLLLVYELQLQEMSIYVYSNSYTYRRYIVL